MYLKVLIIAILSFTSICNASMHKKGKNVNKSMRVHLDEVAFKVDGMFLMKDPFFGVRLSKLVNDKDDYIAFFRIDFVCGECGKIYDNNPGVCESCGSSDIREREIDLWPIG